MELGSDSEILLEDVVGGGPASAKVVCVNVCLCMQMCTWEGGEEVGVCFWQGSSVFPLQREQKEEKQIIHYWQSENRSMEEIP